MGGIWTIEGQGPGVHVRTQERHVSNMSGVSDDRKAANVRFAFLFIIQAADTIAFAIIAASDAETTALIVAVTGEAA